VGGIGNEKKRSNFKTAYRARFVRIVIKTCKSDCYMRAGVHVKKEIIQDNDGFWHLGIAGQTCDTVCHKYKCDAMARSELNTDHSMKTAVDMAGSNCLSTSNSPSDADGAPFVVGGGTKACTMYKSSNKKMASCDTNSISGGLPICYCGTNPSEEEEIISTCGKDDPCIKIDGGIHDTFSDNTKRTYSCVSGSEDKNLLRDNSKSTIDSNAAWIACEDSVGQWMQIDLSEERDVAWKSMLIHFDISSSIKVKLQVLEIIVSFRDLFSNVPDGHDTYALWHYVGI